MHIKTNSYVYDDSYFKKMGDAKFFIAIIDESLNCVC